MQSDLIVCDSCGIAKNWRRFRLRLGGGVQKEVSTCSTCRAKQSRLQTSQKIRLQKKLERQIVLNRTVHEKQAELGVPYYFPKVERMIHTYANKRTAMDRKYLRDFEHEPLHPNPYTAKQQLQAREHAKGWVGFYDELLNHAINLLRQTGKRPTWAQLEASADLQKLYGIYDTKRAAVLRSKG